MCHLFKLTGFTEQALVRLALVSGSFAAAAETFDPTGGFRNPNVGIVIGTPVAEKTPGWGREENLGRVWIPALAGDKLEEDVPGQLRNPEEPFAVSFVTDHHIACLTEKVDKRVSHGLERGRWIVVGHGDRVKEGLDGLAAAVFALIEFLILEMVCGLNAGRFLGQMGLQVVHGQLHPPFDSEVVGDCEQIPVGRHFLRFF